MAEAVETMSLSAFTEQEKNNFEARCIRHIPHYNLDFE
jgi:hypothetical protein